MAVLYIPQQIFDYSFSMCLLCVKNYFCERVKIVCLDISNLKKNHVVWSLAILFSLLFYLYPLDFFYSQRLDKKRRIIQDKTLNCLCVLFLFIFCLSFITQLSKEVASENNKNSIEFLESTVCLCLLFVYEYWYCDYLNAISRGYIQSCWNLKSRPVFLEIPWFTYTHLLTFFSILIFYLLSYCLSSGIVEIFILCFFFKRHCLGPFIFKISTWGFFFLYKSYLPLYQPFLVFTLNQRAWPPSVCDTKEN